MKPRNSLRGSAGSVIDFHLNGTGYASQSTLFYFLFLYFYDKKLLIYIIYFIIFYSLLLFYFTCNGQRIQNVFLPRLTYKRVEPVVSIS